MPNPPSSSGLRIRSKVLLASGSSSISLASDSTTPAICLKHRAANRFLLPLTPFSSCGNAEHQKKIAGALQSRGKQSRSKNDKAPRSPDARSQNKAGKGKGKSQSQNKGKGKSQNKGKDKSQNNNKGKGKGGKGRGKGREKGGAGRGGGRGGQ
eukprot:SAG11_NODE_3071_length_2713_cov_16.731446_3_plen_153_part_00